MSNWLALYRDDNGLPKQAIIEDRTDSTMPFGSLAEAVIDDLPDYNRGGGCFIIALDGPGLNVPMVIDHQTDNDDVERHYITI